MQATNFGFDADMAEVALLQGLAEREKAEGAETEDGLVAADTEAKGPGAADETESKRAARQRERDVRDHLRNIVDSLIEEYTKNDRGMEIREVAGGYRIATKPEYHDAVRAFIKSLKPPMKLSLQALETLAVIAYKQPITAPEIAEIRGVDAGGVLGSLISRKLITTAGRKQVIGRPILYKTTREFLLRFGLKDLNELPSIEEFEKLAGEMEIGEDETIGEAAPLPFDESAQPAAEMLMPDLSHATLETTEHGAPSLATAPSSTTEGFDDSTAEVTSAEVMSAKQPSDQPVSSEKDHGTRS